MSPLQKIVHPFLARADDVLEDGYVAVLYGSLARGEQIPGWSDINLLLIVERMDFDVLAGLLEPMDSWTRAGLAPPLVMGRAEWERAQDVFPIEITDMQVAYKVLRGHDPLKEIQVPRAALRTMLERDLRGTLNKLRQGYLPVGRRPEGLGRLAAGSVASVMVLLRSLLALAGKDARGGPGQLVERAAGLAGFQPGALAAIVEQRGSKRWTCSRPQFEEYVRAVEAMVAYVDQLQSGDDA